MGCGARAAPAGTCSCPPTPAPALADYLEHERPRDTGPDSTAVFLSAASIGSRRPDGRLSVRAVNPVCEQIGRWHDADHPDPARHLSPLRPHDYADTRVMPMCSLEALWCNAIGSGKSA